MAEYQRFAKEPSYQVETPITRGDAAQAKAQQDIQRQQEFYNSNRIVDQQRIENARFAGQNLQALAPFAQSIVKQIEEIEKQSFKIDFSINNCTKETINNFVYQIIFKDKNGVVITTVEDFYSGAIESKKAKRTSIMIDDFTRKNFESFEIEIKK